MSIILNDSDFCLQFPELTQMFYDVANQKPETGSLNGVLNTFIARVLIGVDLHDIGKWWWDDSMAYGNDFPPEKQERMRLHPLEGVYIISLLENENKDKFTNPFSKWIALVHQYRFVKGGIVGYPSNDDIKRFYEEKLLNGDLQKLSIQDFKLFRNLYEMACKDDFSFTNFAKITHLDEEMEVVTKGNFKNRYNNNQIELFYSTIALLVSALDGAGRGTFGFTQDANQTPPTKEQLHDNVFLYLNDFPPFIQEILRKMYFNGVEIAEANGYTDPRQGMYPNLKDLLVNVQYPN
jgi:hypothetical protein